MLFLGLFALLVFSYGCIQIINNMFKEEGYVLHICCTNYDLKSLYFDQKNYDDDAGFDLYLPTDIEIDHTLVVNLDVRCMMTLNKKPCAFYLYPRSSICKTPLLLHNSTGIIDKNYRGALKVAFLNTHHDPIRVFRGTRLVQICAPGLSNFKIKHVECLPNTSRGSNGFGSTGR